MRRSPRQNVWWPSDDELKTRISFVPEVDDCVCGAFVFRIGAGGDVILGVDVF